MTRDEIRGIIEGISDEQLKKILDINSFGIFDMCDALDMP